MGFFISANCKSFAISGRAGMFPQVKIAARIVLPGMLVCSLFLAGRAVPSAPQENRPKVLTTILPLYCFASGVAGNPAQVDNVLPENASGHDYQLSAQDARKLNNADLVIATGLGLEDALLGRRLKTPAIKAAAGIDPIRGHVHEDHRHGEDANPHFWLDPVLAAHAVTNILQALQKADSKNADTYARNAAAYVARLHKLDQEIATALAPYRGRPLVTYHDAFPYFARRYGLQVVG